MLHSYIRDFAELEIGDRPIFIDGEATTPNTNERLDVISPRDGKMIGTIANCGQADVDRAVASARRSFESGVWSRAAPAKRKSVLLRLAELIERDAGKLAVTGVRDNGTEIQMALPAEPGSAAATFRFYAEAIDKMNGEVTPSSPDILSLVRREPLGIIGVIVPWNFPLMIGAWKLAPALAAGNSVVLKPSEAASLSLLMLAELAAEAGLPSGVLNVVTGRGRTTGEAIGLHNDIDALAFTGSGAVGRTLLEYSARSNLKRVWLELGGKSPNIVFEDCTDIATTAQKCAAAMFRNSGQVCVAPSRLIVQSSIYDAFLEVLSDTTKAFRVGDPLDETTQIGAVTTRQQLDRNLDFIARARAHGDNVVTGGSSFEPVGGGFYLEPTIIEAPSSTSPIIREEVFGPVLAVQPFTDEADAVRLANDTPYGLSSGVWTTNLARAHRMTDSVRAGVVHVNCYGGADITVPLSGQRQSGNAADRSLHAIAQYQNLKTSWINLAG